MGRGRTLIVAALAVLLAIAVGQSWINGHTVNLVVVNASGSPVVISWESAPGLPTTSEIEGGCASLSLPLSRGSVWRVTAQDGQTLLDSTSAALPLLEPLIAIELWLEPDGTARVVPAHEVSRLVDAPDPDCQNVSANG